MQERNIYSDIAKRTQGDIYIGVVGPVRTGKSTFIKRFMDALVLPNIESQSVRDRATDELPQSAAGRTIMTTEPKFIPENAVEISLQAEATFRVRLIDCVGYIVPSSLGYIEGESPRMVKTPWFEHEIPFNMAAEIGTQKVISEHSTIGLVITTDGSISEIPRSEYEEAEGRVISELKGLKKPFVVLLNSTNPESDEVKNMAASLTDKYGVPVMPVNCLEIGEEEIKDSHSGALRVPRQRSQCRSAGLGYDSQPRSLAALGTLQRRERSGAEPPHSPRCKTPRRGYLLVRICDGREDSENGSVLWRGADRGADRRQSLL